tara:strand:+ start:656 stop:2431 length:1776 start_codon:yes stop_codon:yes gene_type:complete
MKVNKKKFIIQLLSFIDFINHKYNDNKNINDIKNNILIHFFKSHFLVRLFVKITFLYLNSISILVNFSKIQNLQFKKYETLIFFLHKIKLLRIEKVVELFHALLIIHFNAKERKKIKIFKNDKQKKDFYENIVVGSGPSGSITASTLLDNNKDVLLIEKGNSIEHFELKHPGNELLTKWKNGGLASSIGSSQIQYASAECFGGGSEINSGLYHEPNEEFLLEWKNKFKTDKLSYKDLLPFISETKKITNVSYLEKSENNIINYIKVGAEKNNWKLEEIPRWVFKDKTNYKKKSMTESYLKKYHSSDGSVLLNSYVKKIRKLDSLWQVTIVENNKIKIYKCKNLFLCCGSIYSNNILKKSNLLEKKNIINFHPMSKVIVKFPQKINSEGDEVTPHQLTEFLPNFIIGSAASGLQFLKIASFSNNNLYNEIKKNWEYMAIFHVTFSLGEGSVYNFPLLKDPIINYKIKNSDLKIVKEGIKKLCKLLIDSGCEYVYPLIDKSKKLDKSNYLDFIDRIKSLKEINFSSVHIMGGAPMGETSDCITDSFGKVFNHENLYINDSSLICSKLLKNPQGTVMAIALRNIKKFIENNISE